MARFMIYSKDGQIKRHEGEPQYSGSYMGVDFVEFRTISSPTPIDWQIGDYVDYYRTGKRYRLYSLPMPKKVARKGEYGASFEYSNVQLYGATKELEIAPFRDLVTKDNKIHFSTRPDVSTYEDVYGVARRIQECMDDLYPNKWRIEVYDTDDADLLALLGETKEYSVSGGNCLNALSQIYDTWKNVGWIHTYDSANGVDVITIGRANVRNEDNTSDSFAYGIGKGLTSIKKASANKDEFATRLYIYGSERNIQTRYYNGLNILNKDSVDIRNLMLPIEKWGKTNGLPDASKAYLQADDSIIEKYGLIPRTVYFDGSKNEEIYPSIKGLTMAKVRQAMIDAGEGNSEYLPSNTSARIDQVKSGSTTDAGDKESVESHRSFVITLNQVGFNIAEQGKLTSEGHATISMKSGKCAGRDFKVLRCENVADEGVLRLTLERVWDESVGLGYPNTSYEILAGDELVLLDIPMPDYYITLAANELLEAGEKMLADYTKVSAFYEPSVDAIKIKAGSKLLQAGMFMQVYDEDIIDTADNKDYVLIDTLTIDEKSDLPIYKVTLREQKRSARTYSALEDMIEDAKEVSRQDIRRERQYTDRRFRSAQQSLELLQAAFRNFSEGINPVTVRTMAMLVGDESLQFKFTASRNSLTDIACPFSYDEKTKQMKSAFSYLKHMTLGIKTVTTGTMPASSYETWSIPIWESAVLDDGAKSYYVYVKASKSDSTSECLLSETPIGMEDVSGYYHFLVGILNSEYDGKRDFITLYGFTEVLPGQITTDVLRSANSNLIIDLLNAKISAKNGATIEGKMIFQSGSSGLENLSEWSEKQQEIDNANENSSAAREVAISAKAATETLDTKISNIETGVNESVAEINKRLDGVVENYYEEGAPALDKKPVTDWVAASEDDDYELINHVGDTYTNIEEYVDDATTPDAGKSWRWCWCDDSSITDKIEVTDKEGVTRYLHWHPIADSDAVKALLEAYKAQTTADGKSRIFVNQPTPPYKEGDLWVQGPKGDTLRCKDGVNRTSGSYDASEWELASKYTDDTKANEAKNAANAAKEIAQNAQLFANALNNDTILTEVEKREIRRLMSEITECTDASVTEYNARVVRSAVSGNEWYLVNDKSYAEWYDEDSDEDVKLSQKAWAGYYSSDMHTNGGTTVTRLNLTVYKSLNLKVKFGSDAESSYDYLNVGALDTSVVATDNEHNLTDPTMQASTRGRQGITNAMTKTFAFDGNSPSHFIELSYKKDSSDSSGTDSGYYRLMNESYMGADGNEYIVEMNGSFHRYYLTLMRNGYTAEATELKTRLNNLMSFLYSNELWESGSSTIDATFRASLNDLVAKYYAYVAEIGFDIAMDRINDAEYLTNAMKNGRTIIDGGLVMSSMVAVADTESASDADVEAFLNGSDFASDTTHGKMILAGGIPESVDIDGVTSTDLKERAKRALTRIYEDGTIVTNSGKIASYEIEGDSIIATDQYDNKVILSLQGILLKLFSDTIRLTTATSPLEDIPNMSVVRKNVLTNSAYYNESIASEITNNEDNYASDPKTYVALRVAARNEAIRASRGQFAGLRPKTRVITTTMTSNYPNVLTDLDYSVFVNLTSGTCYISLPNAPQDGQEYYIESKGASMNIKVYQPCYSLYSGSTTSAGNAVTQSGRSLLRFKYYADASLWTCSWLNRNS